jgi:hypothetical protein
VEAVVAVSPAGGRTDDIAGKMLAKLLALRGIAVRALMASAMPERGKTEPADGVIKIICISAVPPIGWRRVRHVCKGLRLRFPGVKLILGLWGAQESLAELRESLASCKIDRVVASFEEVVSAVEALSET